MKAKVNSIETSNITGDTADPFDLDPISVLRGTAQVPERTFESAPLSSPDARQRPASTPITVTLQGDFPAPAILLEKGTLPLVWDEDGSMVDNYRKLATRLAAIGDIFRRPAYGDGLLLGSKHIHVPSAHITIASAFQAIIADRMVVSVVKNGRIKGSLIPTGHLNVMLKAEQFLQHFLPIDEVVHTPTYLQNFSLTAPGYNDGGRGQRVLFVGTEARICESHETIARFLDAMPFASNADRTNAVAAALSRKLRRLFPGGKPIVVVTANKSHAGKGTIIMFVAGNDRTTVVAYQATDWALERAIVGALNLHPDTALLNIDNARLDSKTAFISSGFVEGLITNPEPTLFSTGSGKPTSRPNDLLLSLSTNFGSLSNDLTNRSLPIHLELAGNIEDRARTIGNPREEYLPANMPQMEAELCGMIERWKRAGCPLDLTIKHPMTVWAQTVGGILKLNGFADFLGNYSTMKTAEDPLRKALGLLGAAKPNSWRTAGEWVQTTAELGLINTIIPSADRGNETGCKRGIGVVLTAHRDETLHVETDDEQFELQLVRSRRRFDSGEPSTRYKFEIIRRTPIPADGEQ